MSAESFSDLATQLDAIAGLFVSHVSEASTNPKLDRCSVCWERWPCDAVEAREGLRAAAAALRSAGPVLNAADAWITAEVGFTDGTISARALYDAKSILARAARGRRSPTPPDGGNKVDG
jgi:hypothetical protein